jgi:hypothetical protein
MIQNGGQRQSFRFAAAPSDLFQTAACRSRAEINHRLCEENLCAFLELVDGRA